MNVRDGERIKIDASFQNELAHAAGHRMDSQAGGDGITDQLMGDISLTVDKNEKGP